MKSQAHPQKEQFFDLLNRACCKPEKLSPEKQGRKTSCDCTDKRTRSHKTASTSEKRGGKSHQ